MYWRVFFYSLFLLLGALAGWFTAFKADPNHGVMGLLTGTLLGSVVVVGASPEDMEDGCRDRYVGMYQQVSRWARSVRENERVVNLVACLQSWR